MDNINILEERKGETAMKGEALTLLGKRLGVGDKAPDFILVNDDLSEIRLSEFLGQNILISAVPSIDTGVCDSQTRRFNEEASKIKDTIFLTVSMDLPFAHKRWCEAANAKDIRMLSDYRYAAFGSNYGVLIKELHLLARSIFIIDPSGVIKYTEIVPEMTQHPNYDAALAALSQHVC